MTQPVPVPVTTGAAGSLNLDAALAKRAPNPVSEVVPATPGTTGQPTSFASPVPKGSTVGSAQGVSVNIGTGTTAPTKAPDIPKDLDWDKGKTVVQGPSQEGKIVKATFAIGTARSAKVKKVGDGDGVTGELADGSQISCRLNNIDAPETAKDAYTTVGGKAMKASPAQAYGAESQKGLEDMILNKQVTIKVSQVKDGRPYCEVHFEGKDVSLAQVEKGLAMVYTRFVAPELRGTFYAAQEKAKKDRLNLWKDTNPIPGEKFRRLYNP